MFDPMNYVDLTDPKIIVTLVVVAGLAQWSRIWGIRRQHLEENKGYVKLVLAGLFCLILAVVMLL
jgi:hypothetical protein